MVHLLSRGYVLPVVGYIRKCLEKLNTDISLIRYFVTEVMAVPGLGDPKQSYKRVNTGLDARCPHSCMLRWMCVCGGGGRIFADTFGRLMLNLLSHHVSAPSTG